MSVETFRRVRRILTWEAGTAGLISDRGANAIALMLMFGRLRPEELRLLVGDDRITERIYLFTFLQVEQ